MRLSDQDKVKQKIFRDDSLWRVSFLDGSRRRDLARSPWSISKKGVTEVDSRSPELTLVEKGPSWVTQTQEGLQIMPLRGLHVGLQQLDRAVNLGDHSRLI